MDPKQKPSVVITTYASSCSVGRGTAMHQAGGRSAGDEQETEEQCNTNLEQSTHLFNNRSHPSAYDLQTHAATVASTNRYRSKSRCLNQIKGPTGSIRGHRDVVRKSLENITSAASSSLLFASPNSSVSLDKIVRHPADIHHTSLTTQQLDELYRREYLKRLIDEEQGKCVAYTTTLGIIRRTFEDSKLMKTILNLNLIKFEERDIYLNQEYKQHLRMRCEPPIMIPVLFVNGELFGGIKELEFANEAGKFPSLLGDFKMARAPSQVCMCCGNAKFIACRSCNGSRKSAIHHFKYNSVALRCIKCDKNGGLVQCPLCTTSGQHLATTIIATDSNNNELTSSCPDAYDRQQDTCRTLQT